LHGTCSRGINTPYSSMKASVHSLNTFTLNTHDIGHYVTFQLSKSAMYIHVISHCQCQRQLGGKTSPTVLPRAFRQEDLATRMPLYVSLTSCKLIPLHGLLLLQLNVTATGVIDHPRMSTYFTWLILILELCNKKHHIRHVTNKRWIELGLLPYLCTIFFRGSSSDR
jgi:hypothetical protein